MSLGTWIKSGSKGYGVSAIWGTVQKQIPISIVKTINSDCSLKKEYMKDIFVQIQEKVTQVVPNLSKLIENELVNTLYEQFLVADCKKGPIVLEIMLDYFIEKHSKGKIETVPVLTEYYKRKSEPGKEKNDCHFNDINFQNIFLYSFSNQLN